MDKALGFVEYSTVPTGMVAADKMLKTAKVELLQAQTVCPGKYIVLIRGSLSAVKAAVESGVAEFGSRVIDSFVLGNPHESIYSAITGTSIVGKVDALGILETFSSASIFVAADTAAKTAAVNLMEIRVARGMCGKNYMLISGDLTAVQAAIEAAEKVVSEGGMLLESSVIPNPDKSLWEKLI